MIDKNAAGQSNKKRKILEFYFACGSLMVMILLLDLSIPLGVAVSVSYIAVVLISLWSPQKRFTLIIGIACSILTVGAFLYKPPAPEMWKVIFNRTLSLLVIWVTVWLGLQRKVIEQERTKALREREKSLEDLQILRGLLPICASCKKIRDDQGYWTEIEWYIKKHSEADFSHGICPECARNLYPEVFKNST